MISGASAPEINGKIALGGDGLPTESFRTRIIESE